jgi:hypothetical protein
MRTRILVVVGVAIAVLAGVFLWMNWPRSQPAVTAAKPSGAYDSMDVALQDMAAHATTKLGGENDFQVVPSEVVLPIGALVEKGRSIPEDDVACAVDPEPHAYAVVSLFPDMTFTRSLAGNFGLDDDAFQQLGKAGVDTSHLQSVVLKLKSTSIMALSGQALKDLLARAACHDAIAGRQLFLVRGYIIGQRNFELTDVRTNGVGLDTKVGSFKISPDGKDAVAVSDDQPERFLQIVSEVTAPAETVVHPHTFAPGPVPPPAPVAVSKPSQAATPAPPPGQGRLYIQRDVADDPETALAVRGGLKVEGYDVVDGIQAVPSAKMPNSAQVRYFNQADLAKATGVAAALKGLTHADVKVVRIPLPSPPGQLEIWLQRKG